MASTGLRVSEAIHLQDADVDLKSGIDHAADQVCQIAPVAITPALQKRWRATVGSAKRHVPTTANIPFFMGTRGSGWENRNGDRQVHRVLMPAR